MDEGERDKALQSFRDGVFFRFPYLFKPELLDVRTVAVSVGINKQCHKQNNAIKTDIQTVI